MMLIQSLWVSQYVFIEYDTVRVGKEIANNYSDSTFARRVFKYNFKIFYLILLAQNRYSHKVCSSEIRRMLLWITTQMHFLWFIHSYLRHVRAAPVPEMAGGFKSIIACQRAVQDAFCGLCFVPSGGNDHAASCSWCTIGSTWIDDNVKVFWGKVCF
jgi:hypothetical protein